MAIAGFEASSRHSEGVARILGEDLEFLPPGLILESDRPEWHHVFRSILWAGRQNLAADATHFGVIGIRNPTGSGLLVVVTFAVISNTGPIAYIPQVRTRGQAVGDGTSTTFFRDSRRGFGGGCPVLLVFNNSTYVAAPGSGPIELVDLQAANNEGVVGSTPYILAPGTDFLITTPAVNQALDCSFAGYARVFRPEEIAV